MEQPVLSVTSLSRNTTPPTVQTPLEPQNSDKNPMTAPIPTTLPETEPPPLSSLLPTISEVPHIPLAAADTVSYVDTVKAQLHDKPEAYEQFLVIMNGFSAKDHASQVAEAHSVAERVAVLFQGYPDLMPQFNAYMTKLRKSSPPERSPPREGSLPTDPLPHAPKPQPPVNASPAPTNALPLNPEMDDANRPLNVTDALSYLDAVKLQFWEKPDVYNNFLDIMKDFKCQVIDTPGVIERVSMLFYGHPDLIQGFNTFLPPGYRIECTTGPSEHNIITVTTPSGTTTQSTDETHPFRMTGPAASAFPLATAPSGPPPGPGFAGQSASAVSSRPATPLPMATSRQNQVPPAPASPSIFGGSHHAASFLGALSANGRGSAADKQVAPGQDEFHHAIQYVNKIKTRFEDDTDTYKQFLEILHAYRKEQNTRDDSQVYAQVQVLFKDAPDLLAEFKDFLPSAGGFAGVQIHTAATDASEFVVGQSIPADKRAKTDAVPATQKRKKRPVDKDGPLGAPVAAAAKAGPNRTKKVKNAHRPEPHSPTFAAHNSHPPSPAQGQLYANNTHQHQHQQHHGGQPSYQHQGLLGPAHASSSGTGVPTSAQSNVQFFDRAKKALESREAYEEFLKLLALFTNEIIDTPTLVRRAEAFLGDGDLLAQFKDLLSWDDRKDGPDDLGGLRSWSIDSVNRPARETEERSGASYRRLPYAESRLACSGRDELCRSVLNDIWVSHPTWASEESGFVSHKKNSYEEALHKSEEERHEYQFYIEIIARTIALLQPLNERILDMTTEERHAFRLEADFGGSSKSIYHRALKKVYGRDGAGLEVLQALQECPAVAVPVVLPRLKQKHEEWRRAQREWNRVWREVDARNFYKSLDHQGITFKANDKKNITTKSFVVELEAAKAELLERRARRAAAARTEQPSPVVDDSDDSTRAWHLQYIIADMGVLQDSLKLVFSFLDRAQAQYSPQERRAVERVLRAFVPLFFMLPAAEFDAAFGSPVAGDGDDTFGSAEEGQPIVGTGPADDTEETTTGGLNKPSSTSSSPSKSGRRSAGGGAPSSTGGVPPGDLRKKLLKTAQEKASKAATVSATAGSTSAAPSANGSRAVSPVGSDREDATMSPPSPAQSPLNAPPAPAVASTSMGGGRLKTSVSRGADEEVEWDDEWVTLMPVGGGFPADTPDDVLRIGREGLIDQRPFFANTTFYTLFRLIQLLYSRLLMCKETADRLASVPVKQSVFVVNPVAEQLGLVDASGPGAVLALAAHQPPVHAEIPPPAVAEGEGSTPASAGAPMEGAENTLPANTTPVTGAAEPTTGDVDMANADAEKSVTQPVIKDNNIPTEQTAPVPATNTTATAPIGGRAETHFYDYLLDACEKVFEGELEQTTFEENIRFLFGTKAYHVFTLDKLIAALIKQAQTVVVDPKCQELLAMLARCRGKKEMSVREMTRYRREAEQFVGPDDHLYRIEWVSEAKAMQMALVGSSDASVIFGAGKEGEEERAVGRWRVYVESYVLQHGTEMLGEEVRARVRRPFLARNREDEAGDVEGGMEIGVGVKGYRLWYRNGCEESMVRGEREDEEGLCVRAASRESRRRAGINIDV